VDEGAGAQGHPRRIGELLVKNKWPLLDVTSGAYTEEIEKDVLAGLGEHVKSYGLNIPRLGNFVIDIEDADAVNLKKLYTDAAYLRTVGGVGNYQQFAAGKAMMGAGEGMAKGGGAGEGGGPMLSGAGLAVAWHGADDVRREPARLRRRRHDCRRSRVPLLRRERRPGQVLRELRQGAQARHSGRRLLPRLRRRHGERGQVLRPVRQEARLTGGAARR